MTRERLGVARGFAAVALAVCAACSVPDSPCATDMDCDTVNRCEDGVCRPGERLVVGAPSSSSSAGSAGSMNASTASASGASASGSTSRAGSSAGSGTSRVSSSAGTSSSSGGGGASSLVAGSSGEAAPSSAAASSSSSTATATSMVVVPPSSSAPVNTPPGAATNLSVAYEPSGGGWLARVTWTPPGDADLAAVKFRLNQDGGTGAWATLAPGTTFQVVGVGNGARVTADMVAVDTGGLEGPQASVDGGYAPLGAPNNVGLTQVGLDRVRATWSAPTGGSVAEYRVTFSGGAGGTFTDGAGTGSRDVVAVPGQGVTVTVEARDGAGRYGHAAQASATPSAPAPGTPSVAAWSYSSVTVQWPGATWADSYDVEFAVNDGGFQGLGNTASTSAGMGVSQDTRYRYRVRARGSVHASGWSGELRISIGHAAFNTVDAWSATNGAVSIWKDHADGVVVPPNANVTEMELHLAATFATSAACCTASRGLVWVANNNAGFSTGSKPNPWNEVVGFNQNGGDLAGLMATGTGWSSAGTGGYRLDGSITVRGNITVNHPEVGNGYW